MHDTATQLLLAETTYGLEVVLFLLLFASYYFTQEKKFVDHQKIMRWMVLIQSIVNINMLYSFFFTSYGSNFVIHAIIGTIVYLIIIYTFLVMEKKLPSFLMIPKQYRKPLMRFTAFLWGIAIISGIISFMVIID